MQSQKLLTLLLFCLLLPFQKLQAQQIPLSDRASVSLLTCGTGEELYATFGHTAIRVYDPLRGIDTVYNFGTFDFSTPNFYLKFVKGDLQYYVSVASYRDFIYEYEYYQRTVYEQELNLSQSQKQGIANELNAILSSDRRFYTYKFIDRNCTTMVADIIADNIDGDISMETSDKGMTNREILYNYLDGHFYEKLGINLMFGYKTDKTADKLFLPNELMEGVSNTVINDKPLSEPIKTVYQGKDKEVPFSFWNSFYSFILVTVLLLFLTKHKIVRITYLLLVGFIGVFFCVIGLFSYHSELTQNYNALLVNPIFLILGLLSFGRNKKIISLFTYLYFLSLLVYVVFMLNKPHLVIILPLLVLNVVTVLRVLRQPEKP
ncbi:hypothetical protein GCM10007424_10220 [Flavobacterium suaedae]|uniref:Lnb N-terminal periplasmic domain-containing protein n=1 Tax=Flavobacterium suaedae TaxID=1767027 RepID=A0ABQ1JMF5_9FLAO|nr:DUF4105 domain-containing protein [Flavobacterium suaedae]GGB72192.1 hypothetical protein GCM10007424_10220 [Flavobacterium suaedae]